MMRKFVASVFFLLLLSTSAFAANFVEIVHSEHYLIYVDTDSIALRGNHIVAWSKWIPRGEEKKGLKKS